MPTIRRSHGQIGTVEHAKHSDAPFSSDELNEVFNVDKADDGSNADASIGNFDKTDGLIELNVEDQLKLFKGNTHPPEYYRQAVVTFNTSDYESEDYALGTTRYLDGIEEQWICWDGTRKRKKVTKSSFFGTYWKVFRLVFEKAISEKIDPKLNRTMHKRRMNRCMTTDDLKLQIETTLGTTKKSFKLGELRILAVLFLLLLAPAGARPTSILRLRFGDLHPVLARDLEGGPPKILIWFSLAFIKIYFGEKKVKLYLIPKTMYDPFLMLSSHVFFLGILFHEHELPLPLRENLYNVYIFRCAFKTLAGYQLLPYEPITFGMMAAWIKRIGEILGVEYPTIFYSLRYNAGNNYFGRNIGVDLWGIIRGQRLQQAIIKQSCSIGHSVSKRRPVDLTPNQAISILTYPFIKRLLRCELKQTIRDKWTAKQAVEDIKQQLHGLGFAEPPKEDSSYRPQRPAQKQLIQALTTPVVPTLKGQYQRRDNAIEAISAYCLVQEGCTIRVRRSPASPTKHTEPTLFKPSCKSPKQSLLSLATLSIFVKNETEQPRRCFICVGQALSLAEDDDQINNLISKFFMPCNLTKHFKQKHLSKLQNNNPVQC
ncbi:C2H2 finger domain protein [Ustulina deusta]|nr:C2H2 finger domain protein [Ustulina deusta]